MDNIQENVDGSPQSTARWPPQGGSPTGAVFSTGGLTAEDESGGHVRWIRRAIGTVSNLAREEVPLITVRKASNTGASNISAGIYRGVT